MKHCGNCGTRNTGNYKICQTCGVEFKDYETIEEKEVEAVDKDNTEDKEELEEVEETSEESTEDIVDEEEEAEIKEPKVEESKVEESEVEESEELEEADIEEEIVEIDEPEDEPEESEKPEKPETEEGLEEKIETEEEEISDIEKEKSEEDDKQTETENETEEDTATDEQKAKEELLKTEEPEKKRDFKKFIIPAIALIVLVGAIVLVVNKRKNAEEPVADMQLEDFENELYKPTLDLVSNVEEGKEISVALDTTLVDGVAVQFMYVKEDEEWEETVLVEDSKAISTIEVDDTWEPSIIEVEVDVRFDLKELQSEAVREVYGQQGERFRTELRYKNTGNGYNVKSEGLTIFYPSEEAYEEAENEEEELSEFEGHLAEFKEISKGLVAKIEPAEEGSDDWSLVRVTMGEILGEETEESKQTFMFSLADALAKVIRDADKTTEEVIEIHFVDKDGTLIDAKLR